MADPTAGPAQDEAAPVRRASPKTIAAIAAAALAGGAGLGAFVTGPLVAARVAGPPAAAPHADSTADSSAAPGPVHLLDNMVLNPAGTNGARFLLVSVALQARNEEGAAQLKAYDAAIRDGIQHILGTCTIDELTDITRRDSLKSRIRSQVDSLLRHTTVSAVFFPQFVIQ